MAERFRWRAALFGALLVVVLVPAPVRAQSTAVAVIDQGGGDGVVDRAEADRWIRYTYDPVRAKRLGITLPGRNAGWAILSLIEAEWLMAEARDAGVTVTVTDAELDAHIGEMRRTRYLTAGDLERSGLTIDDLRGAVWAETLRAQVEQRLVSEPPAVTDADVRAYVREHPEVLRTDERRRVALVMTLTRRRAHAARTALQAGRSWQAVIERYGDVDTHLGGGGVLRFESSWGENEKLRRAMFRTRRGEIVGPVATDDGWAVFEVRSITPSRRLKYQDVAPGLKRELAYWRGQEALTAWRAAYRTKWRLRTSCLADFFSEACGATLPSSAPPA
ncbi:MAG: peptidyl-prolyl cis-trans isomerase [Solirubrobacteraceae bacterium]|nr:peptidyl-prolyl cis-trans isomerase [Solirubrobacteraceae bacterium]